MSVGGVEANILLLVVPSMISIFSGNNTAICLVPPRPRNTFDSAHNLCTLYRMTLKITNFIRLVFLINYEAETGTMCRNKENKKTPF